MKSLRFLASIGLFAGAMLTTGQAFDYDLKVVVAVPFSFTANGVTLPAGDYVVSNDSYWNALRIRDQHGPASAFLQAHASLEREAAKNTKLVFNRFGDRYFLESISKRGDARRFDLAKSRNERELERSGARPAVTMLIGKLR